MRSILEEAKQKRIFLARDLQITSWNDVRPYFEQLLAFQISSDADLKKFLAMRSELDAAMEEDMSWRYIKMTCNTTDESLRERFNVFVTEISPEADTFSNKLDKYAQEAPNGDFVINIL